MRSPDATPRDQSGPRPEHDLASGGLRERLLRLADTHPSSHAAAAERESLADHGAGDEASHPPWPDDWLSHRAEGEHGMREAAAGQEPERGHAGRHGEHPAGSAPGHGRPDAAGRIGGLPAAADGGDPYRPWFMAGGPAPPWFAAGQER